MLARAGEIPRGRGWTFEPKLDGFRCLVCTHASFLARSRRGWDMTHLLPEFRPLPCLSAFSLTASSSRSTTAGRPDFDRLSSRLLHGRSGITVTLFVFDVLAVEGLPTTMLPYSAHRTLLEELDLESHRVRLVATFEDGAALFRPRSVLAVSRASSRSVSATRTGPGIGPG